MSGPAPGASAPRVTRTDPSARDARLRGRTYAIPFDRVWRAALGVAGGGLTRWRLLDADDARGVVNAEATSLVLRGVSAIRIDVGLDENAQTRVDVTARTVERRPLDSGRNARFVGAFLKRLDRELGARPGDILDPGRAPSRRRAPNAPTDPTRH